ncbi:MAG: C1 family peptidase [Bacteroidaceae bacterium]|nr:C1 family peptidase [Bacteroidaceae bacterium]
MRKLLLALLLAAPFATPLATMAQSGAITPQLLSKFRKQSSSKADLAIQNALIVNGIDMMATKPNTAELNDTYFSNEAPSRGITDQASSGRCWLFTGLNVMRAHVIQRQQLRDFQFSQSFNSFYDQLEKSNLFLQSIIDYANRPMDDKTVEWLFKNPISDGGTFTGVQDIVTKYGAVPADIMPESYNANNTARMASILSLKLREYGLTLRKAYAAGERGKKLQARKEEMLSTIYRILVACLGEPPTEFTWAPKAADGRPLQAEKFTPLSFYQRFVGWDLINNYVLLMNDPTRPYYKTYSIDLDRHAYDGHNWTYLNLPLDEIKQMAIASIKDSVRMYFSCDVGKFYNKKSGVLSLNNYDYGSVFNIDFPMTKAERIQTFASASSHAMTLCAVDLDPQGKPRKWKVENSWGLNSGIGGHLIMTDEWFDEYMFRLVVERRFVPETTLRLLDQTPTLLPAWDPLFKVED